MTDLLATGLSYLVEQLKSHASQTVTYKRGSLSVSLSATIGRTEFERIDADGFQVKTEARDYLIKAADLVLDGEVTFPVAGDRIEETRASVLYTYEVMALDGQPAYRLSDPHGYGLRIHTKQVIVPSS